MTDTPRLPPAPTSGAMPSPPLMVDDRGLQAFYANFCRVNATPEEVVLDFGLNAEPGTPNHPIQLSQRLVLNFYTAKRLGRALEMALRRHEEAFGPLEIDIQKRLRSHNPGGLGST